MATPMQEVTAGVGPCTLHIYFFSESEFYMFHIIFSDQRLGRI